MVLVPIFHWYVGVVELNRPSVPDSKPKLYGTGFVEGPTCNGATGVVNNTQSAYGVYIKYCRSRHLEFVDQLEFVPVWNTVWPVAVFICTVGVVPG